MVGLRVHLIAYTASVLFAGGVGAQSTDFVLTLSDSTGTSVSPVAVQLVADVNGAEGLRSLSVPVCHDPTLVDLVGVEEGEALALIAPILFFDVQLSPGGGAGFGAGIVTDGPGGVLNALPPGQGYEILVISYQPTGLGTSAVSFCPGTLPLGGGFFYELVVDDTAGNQTMPIANDGSIQVTPPGTPFLRGDANQDDTVDLADPIFMLAFLFTFGPAACLEAFDANGSGVVDIADVVSLLDHLFGGGPGLPAPYPDCGIAPGGVVIGCAIPPACP